MKVQFGGDVELLAEIYGEYVSSVDSKIAEAKTALAEKNYPLLDRVAHTIKGNALQVGDTEMSETAIAIRKAAALGDDGTAAKLIARLEQLRTLL
jgi:HPt (histidine-containing phosphotransfer) domain-containing protein